MRGNYALVEMGSHGSTLWKTTGTGASCKEKDPQKKEPKAQESERRGYKENFPLQRTAFDV